MLTKRSVSSLSFDNTSFEKFMQYVRKGRAICVEKAIATNPNLLNLQEKVLFEFTRDF
jgi:hypothetical protein